MNHLQQLTATQQAKLITVLRVRFEQHMHRHRNVAWADVQLRLDAAPEKYWSLQQMEESGGEPDVIDYDPITGVFLFCDCSLESPKGRRSLCYDHKALDARKTFKPEGSAVDMAQRMGIELLTAAVYQTLQQFGPFDTKTSSWLKTPPEIRALGGAIFGDYRYGQAFIYHNGADSYYAARGFRGMLRV